MQLLTDLHAPHVVRYYGYNETKTSLGTTIYSMAMECIPGSSLRQYIIDHPGQPLDWARRYEIMKEIIDAVSFLHKNGIIHRDIKSGNVLIDENMHSYLIDFGFALKETNNHERIPMGTPPWVAPEVWKGKDHTFKMDIYSYCMFMWEVAAWDSPYKKYEEFEDAAKELGKAVVYSGLRERIPRTCKDKIGLLIRWGWLEKPELRPSADQIKAELGTPINDISDTLLQVPRLCRR